MVSCYNSSLLPVEKYPAYKGSAVKRDPNSSEEKSLCQRDQFLLNELVGFCHEENGLWFVQQGEGDYFSGGLVDGNALVDGDYVEPTHVVCEPLVQCEQGFQKITVSLGTKFKVTGESMGLLRVQLPQGACALVDKNALGSLKEISLLSDEDKRAMILCNARKLLGQPYMWGGRSAFEGSGFDCAGLVKTVFSTCGIEIPRAVHFQYLKATPIIKASDLKPGDLLFTLQKTISRNNHSFTAGIHVMIWAGQNMLIEASPESMTVREASLEEVTGGLSLEKLENGETREIENAVYWWLLADGCRKTVINSV